MAQLLGAASREARGTTPLSFSVAIEDQAADDLERFRHDHPELASHAPIEHLWDARAALAALPITSITSIDSEDPESPFQKAELVSSHGVRMTSVTVKVGEEWVVGMALEGDRISSLRVVRRIPPPF